MMRTIVEGDNGESKLVFVLHSRHEALVGTMGTQCYRLWQVHWQGAGTSTIRNAYTSTWMSRWGYSLQ